MHSLALLLCVFLAVSASAQDSLSLGKSSVSAVLDNYTINTLINLPDTQKPLPSTGRWSIRKARPDSCPHDDTLCARVVYTIPEAHVVCEWTVVPPQGAKPAAFLAQNEDASRYLVRKLPALDLAPLVLTSPQPIYPRIARAAHISGSVAVRLVVSDKGTVISASVISGPEMLRFAAIDAAKHWTFKALQIGAQPASFTVDLNANFTMAADPRKCTKDDPCWSSTIPEGKVTMNP